MGESVDNGGESILRALARVRVSNARAHELSVAAVSTGAGSTPAEPHKRNSARPAASRVTYLLTYLSQVKILWF